MISLVKKEIIRQWTALTDDKILPSSLNFMQISGTNWTGGRVRFVVLDQNGTAILFIRMMRNPEKDCLLEEEYHLIASLIAIPALSACLPELCFFGKVGGQKFVVERAVVGQSLFKKMRKRVWNSCSAYKSNINLANSFLLELARATRKRVSKEQLTSTVLGPLNDFYLKTGGEASDLEALIEKLVRNTKGCLETVATHGDFSLKNIILGPDGSYAVIDWETAQMNGLPLIDLFYFLSRYAYLSGSSRHKNRVQRIKAFYKSSGSKARLAIHAVEYYCLQMKYDPGIIKPLFLLHFLYKAWLKCRMSGMDDKSTKLWLDLFHSYFSSGETPWGL